ncbi:MAG: cobalamin B12-binding domain-containing protein [Candidatus Helarchaeota archaeon]|nr:cobalamin B12-binding domain-containing protein [Candidatus Helarchaeota archaeon]
MSEELKKLEESITNLEKKVALDITNKIIDEKKITAKPAIDAVTKALQNIGELYEKEEYYLAELVYAGDISKAVLGLLEPYLAKTSAEKDLAKRVVIGTVKGDMHDLGKNIVQAFGRGAGYDIIDLGNDVSAEAFIEELKKNSIKILGVSCLLTACDSELDKILTALKDEGLADVKVVIGGAAMTEKLASGLEKKFNITVKFAPDAINGIKIFNELID